MATWQQVLVGVIPSIGVALLFWFVMRAVIRADRNERASIAQQEAEIEAAERARATAEAAGASGQNSGPNSSAASRSAEKSE